MRPLNYRLRLFVHAYLGESSQPAVDAARRAGYSNPEKPGPLLAEIKEVRAAIDAGETTAPMFADEVLARAEDATRRVLCYFRRGRGRSPETLAIARRGP